MKLTLAFGFLLTAALYASVGFGGGSTYTALLAISATPFTIIPIVSLLCNICVVSGNSWRYLRGGLVSFSQSWLLFLLSIPAAMLGGTLNVSEALFLGLLSLALLLAGMRMVFGQSHSSIESKSSSHSSKIICGILGGFIGFYSGIVGIGGGIFLAPVLYRIGWGSGQNIAATCSLFILVNSVAGLTGQITKTTGFTVHAEIFLYWPLILAVFIGGTFGNMLSLHFLKPDHLRRITGVLILLVAIRIALKWLTLISIF